MSPLTKIFVVLHVVLSLLLTAGLIVFVNRTETFKGTLASAVSQKNLFEARATAATEAAGSAKDAADRAVMQVNNQIKDVQGQLSAAQTQLAKKDADLALADSSAKLDAANIAKLTGALQASEDQKTKQADILAQTRTDEDALMHKNSDLNLAVNDLTNKLDVASRERANFAEQLAQTQSENEKQRKQLADAGIAPNSPAGVGNGAYAINGVVRDVKVINQIPYATISVGSADNVQKGMRFQVLDQAKGIYYGQLTVDSVEQNEATGRLDGPKVNEVHKDLEVKTQL